MNFCTWGDEFKYSAVLVILCTVLVLLEAEVIFDALMILGYDDCKVVAQIHWPECKFDKLMGRWHSKAYRLYTHSHQQALKTAANSLANISAHKKLNTCYITNFLHAYCMTVLCTHAFHYVRVANSLSFGLFGGFHHGRHPYRLSYKQVEPEPPVSSGSAPKHLQPHI